MIHNWKGFRKIYSHESNPSPIKVGLPTFEKVAFICFNESPLEMMENAFYLMLKALFVFEISIFFPEFLVI